MERPSDNAYWMEILATTVHTASMTVGRDLCPNHSSTGWLLEDSSMTMDAIADAAASKRATMTRRGCQFMAVVDGSSDDLVACL